MTPGKTVNVALVETREWKAGAGVDIDNVELKLTLQGQFDLTWGASGDIVLTCGHYEALDLPRLLRLLATAVEEVKSESPYEAAA